MNKRNIIMVTVAVILLGLAGYFYATNSGFKDKTNDFISNNITGKEAPLTKEYLTLQVDIYLVADGTGSTHTSYAIPHVTIDFINEMINKIHCNNGGRFWLSYIDQNSKNNECLYFSILPILSKPPKPEQKDGQSSFIYQDSVIAWENRNVTFISDSTHQEYVFNKQKNLFLKNCEELLSGKIYNKGSEDNGWSEVIGSLNHAFKTFDDNKNDIPSVKYVVAFSDLEESLPKNQKPPKLDPIPKDVQIIVVNPQPKSSKKVTIDVIEVPAPENAIEKIFNNIKIVKQ